MKQLPDEEFDIEFEGPKIPDEKKIYEMIIEHLMAQGKTREEAEEEVKKWDREHRKS